MSGLHNKNIIFYSNYSQDKLSSECLLEISKNEKVKNQFILLCIHDLYDISKPPPYKLPKKIVEMSDKGLIPILCISGFKNYILGNSALNWLKQNSEKELNGGVEGYSVESSGIADNCSTVDQAEMVGMEHFNAEYNLGFSTGRGEVGKNYSNIDEVVQSQIVTYDVEDSNGNVHGNCTTEKKKASYEMQKRLDNLQNQRREEAIPITGNGLGNGGHQQRQFFNPGEGRSMPIMPVSRGGVGGGTSIGVGGGTSVPRMPRMNQQQPFSNFSI